ncbi:MAG TPA: DUF1579 family protein [Longimicrobium sp.]|nr:DUF1579 family protein [Longimicrobium sp.]
MDAGRAEGADRRAEAFRALEAMPGTWRGEETIHPAPWDPAGGRAASRVENRIALGGQVLVQDYEQTRGGAAPFTGHGVLRWDDAAGELVLHWFDSLRTAPGEFRGSWEGGTLTLLRHTPGWARARWTFSADRYSYRMDMSADGETWHPYIEGEYTRER